MRHLITILLSVITLCALHIYLANNIGEEEYAIASAQERVCGYIQDSGKALMEQLKCSRFVAPQFGNIAGQKNNYQHITLRKTPEAAKYIIYKKSVAAASSLSKDIRFWDLSISAMLHEISSDYYIISLNKIRC